MFSIENPLRFGEFHQIGLVRVLLLDGHTAEVDSTWEKMLLEESLRVAAIVETHLEAFRNEPFSHR